METAYSDSFWFKLRCWAGNVRVQPGHKAPLPVSPGLHPSVCAMCGDTDVPSCNYFNKLDLSPDLFLFSFALSHFNFMLSPISAKQEPLLIFRPQELKLFCPSDWACLCHCPTAQVCVIFGDKLQGVSKKWWSGLKCHWNGVSSLHSACLELKDTDEQQNLCASSKCA